MNHHDESAYTMFRGTRCKLNLKGDKIKLLQICWHTSAKPSKIATILNVERFRFSFKLGSRILLEGGSCMDAEHPDGNATVLN